MEGITVLGNQQSEEAKLILTPGALQFVASLHRKFHQRRLDLLHQRTLKQQKIAGGWRPTFAPETASIRNSAWQVAATPEDLQRRHVEITGPTSPAKMAINALNSGANGWMADFEDALSPVWEKLLDGQRNLHQAVRRTLVTTENNKVYKVNPGSKTTMIVRPRGWQLQERHLLVDGEAVSASMFDFGLHFFHNAKELINRGSGPYYYLPKMESHLEARLWNDIFDFSQETLGVRPGSVKVTVLIETILAAFEMEEILYELRTASCSLNAGRWDYLFSAIKKFRALPEAALPDRGLVTMAVPFMRAYSTLLVQTCHKRGAHAMGGMSAFLPTNDAATNQVAFEKVKADKNNEATLGYDGTWVAHPGLVKIAAAIFEAATQGAAHQKSKIPPGTIKAEDLLNFTIPGAQHTEAGLRSNIRIALLYTQAWLRGLGAVAIDNLMEDAATAEISRAQIWMWIRHGIRLSNTNSPHSGALVTKELYKKLADEVSATVNADPIALAIVNDLILRDDFVDFLTLPAYDHLIVQRPKL